MKGKNNPVEPKFIKVLDKCVADKKALDRITKLMSGKYWDSDTLDAIAEIIRETGRKIKDVSG